MNTCGHEAPRVTQPPRCTECGAYAHQQGEAGMKVAPRRWWLLEWLERREARNSSPPVLSGTVRRVP